MAAPDPAKPVPPALTGDALWLARLRRFGHRGIRTALLIIVALWLHEIVFVDPLGDLRQVWKLRVLIVLIPVALLSALALLIVWLLEKIKAMTSRRRQGSGGPDRI